MKYVHKDPITYFHIVSISDAIFKVEPSDLVPLEHITYWLT